MPISVECPECGTRMRFPDHLAGKSGRCKFCNSRIQVRRGRGKKSKKKQQSGNAGLMIGVIVGVVAGLFVMVIGLYFVLQNFDKNEADQQIAGENPPNSETTPGENFPVAEAPSTLPRGNNSPTTPTPPVKSAFEKTSPSTEGLKVDSELTFSRSPKWSVEPDPPHNDVEFEAGKSLQIKLPKHQLRGNGLVFPVSPSSLVAVHSGLGGKGKYVVHDVAIDQEIGEIPVSSSSHAAALADDGSYFALTLSGNRKIEVFDLKAKKSLGVISTSESTQFNVYTLAIWKNHLVALSSVHKSIMVWELPSGKLVQTIKGDHNFTPSRGHCFSPGGRYVAMHGQVSTKQIDIYDLQTGQLVGSLIPEGKLRVSELEAIGFSRDGTQIAAIYGINIYKAPARKYSRMLVWDLRTGQTDSDFEISPQIKEQLKPAFQSRTLESLPDGDRWLVHSLGIVDLTAGQLIYKFPKQEGIALVPSRKVMGSNWVLAATTEDGDPRLKQITFTQEELLAGVKAAAAGGSPSDARMPPLSASDLNQATDALVNNQWTAQIDPLESNPLPASIQLPKTGAVREIAVSRSRNPVIAIRSGIDEDLTEFELRSYENHLKHFRDRGKDLMQPPPLATETELLIYGNDGEQLSKFRVPFSAHMHGISPDGKFVILEEHRTNGRLDVYGIEGDGKHIVGWRPFQTGSNRFQQEMHQVQFIDSEHVATLNTSNKLVIWKIPDVEAVWKLDEVIHFTVSPGGKLVTAIQGEHNTSKRLAVFDSLSGDGQGTAEITGRVKSIAAHPNGRLLAVSLDSEANKRIQIVDMGSGEVLETFSVPVAANRLAWTGGDHLLLNGTQLVSRSLQAVVWSYDTDKILLPRHQVTEQLSFVHRTGSQPVIHAVDLPSKKSTEQLDPKRLADQVMLKPGDSVNLVVRVDPDTLLNSVKSSASELLTERLKVIKSVVDKNAAIVLTVSISMESNGTTKLFKLGVGSGSKSETVARKWITINSVYTIQGKELWKSSRRVGNLDVGLVRLTPGQSAQKTIDEKMVENTKNFLKTVDLPLFIFSDSASEGLGKSTLLE